MTLVALTLLSLPLPALSSAVALLARLSLLARLPLLAGLALLTRLALLPLLALLSGILPVLAGLAPPGCMLVALVKPQFEAGREALDARGIVRSDTAIERVREDVCAAAAAAGWTVLGWTASPIDGGDGNREFFIHARRQPAPSALA